MCKAVGLLSILLLPLFPPTGLAHIDPATGQDYRDFERRDGKGSCCDWHDCRPATAPVVEDGREVIRDRAANIYDFDQDKVVRRPSDDGNWHVCGNGDRLNCIIAPAES